MNFVQPIRNPNTVRDICAYLKNQNERDYIMFLVGIYTGLRISDILVLRVIDVKNKEQFNIREKKTGKQKNSAINPQLKSELKKYVMDMDDSDYLFPSRQGINKPITRERAYWMLREIGNLFSLDNIGTHTMRKTFGYHFYKDTKDVATLMQIFNHSHPSITLKYIGLTQETTNKAIRKFKIF